MLERRKKEPHPRWVLPAALAVAAIALLFLLRDYRAEVRGHRAVAVERCRTLLDALKAGIQAHGRMGRFRSERLAIVFEELAQTPGTAALALKTEAGEAVASAGDLSLLAGIRPGGTVWKGPHLAMAATVSSLSSGEEGFQGRGRFGRPGAGEGFMAPDVPEGPFMLAAAIDAAESLRKVRSERVTLAISGLFAVLLPLLGALVARSHLQRRALEVTLLAETERATRLEQTARLGAGLAHETKNPLGVVRGLAQSLASAPGAGAEVRRVAAAIIDESDRTVGQINAFLALARPKEPAPAPVGLDAFLSRLVPLVEAEAEHARAAVASGGGGLRVLADEDLLRRAMLNLLLNALRALGENGRIEIRAERAEGGIALRVSDNGCGIAADHLPRVTEPYFSRFEGGSGLGLSIVEQIASAHGWRLRIDSCPGQGTTVSILGMQEAR